MNAFKLYLSLTKIGIVIFVLLATLAGYITGYETENKFAMTHLLLTLFGVYFLSSGSLALNQVQEYELDKKMKRTATRPVASGKIRPLAAGSLALAFLVSGLYLLSLVNLTAAGLGLLTVVLYNGIYTYIWKPKWIYAAVPGALPGALPVSIGYAAVNTDLFNSESIYLFLILFLWQMPHFWALAVRFKDDYADGGVPTLPVALGLDKTFYQMGMYTLLYAGVAIASPFFVRTSWIYILCVVPLSIKLILEFRKYHKSAGETGWFRYFMWVNVSVLVYLFVPAIDKWNFLFFNTN